MGACVTCGKVFLIIFNMIVILVGLGMVTVGILALVGDELIDDAMDEASVVIPDLPYKIHLDGALPPNETTEEVLADMDPYIEDGGIGLIAVGGVIALIGLAGFIGACCTDSCKCCLILEVPQEYAAFVVLIIVAEIVLCGLFFSGWILEYIEDEGEEQIHKEFGGIDTYDPVSSTLNLIMVELECCGWKSYKDFEKTREWNKTRKFDGVEHTMTVAVACCKLEGDLDNVDDYEFVDLSCPWSPNTNNSYIEDGCYDELEDLYEDYKWVALGILCGMMLFQLGLIISACCLFRHAMDDE